MIARVILSINITIPTLFTRTQLYYYHFIFNPNNGLMMFTLLTTNS